MKLSEIYARHYDSVNQVDVFSLVSDILQVGTPIDDNGDDMNPVDDLVYVADESGQFRPL